MRDDFGGHRAHFGTSESILDALAVGHVNRTYNEAGVPPNGCPECSSATVFAVGAQDNGSSMCMARAAKSSDRLQCRGRIRQDAETSPTHLADALKYAPKKSVNAG
jgi:hypothetical protein